MKVTVETDILGIEDTILRWNASERKTLERATSLLAAARELTEEDTELNTELGKAEMWTREFADDFIIRTRIGGA